MHRSGLHVGIATFLLTGSFHVVVIKGEYHFGKGIWSVFAIVGAAALGISLFIANILVGTLLTVFGFTCLWSIKDLFEQEKRVTKG